MATEEREMLNGSGDDKSLWGKIYYNFKNIEIIIFFIFKY